MVAARGYWQFVETASEFAIMPAMISPSCRQRTIERICTQATVLCVQDGTDSSFRTCPECDGLVVIGHNQTSAESCRVHLHATVALNGVGLQLWVPRSRYWRRTKPHRRIDGLRSLADAYTALLKKQRRFPRFKKRGQAKKSVRVDLSMPNRITSAGRFRLKRGMWMQLTRYERVYRYGCPVAKQATIFEEHGLWYLSVGYEVDAVDERIAGPPVGMDRNVRQVATSDGRILNLTDTAKLDRRIRRLQKRLARQTPGSNRRTRTKYTIARHQRKRKHLRQNDLRHIVKEVVGDRPSIVILEDLKTKGMTRSAKGTVDQPGTNVKAKAGLNRAILESG